MPAGARWEAGGDAQVLLQHIVGIISASWNKIVTVGQNMPSCKNVC